MASYRVCFMNQFARNRTVYRICQRAVVIRCAHTRARAIEAAKKRFARLERIRDWRIHASEIEGEMIESDPRNPDRLRELAAWYREFAERAGDPAIWETRLRMAKDLDAEAKRLELGSSMRKSTRMKRSAWDRCPDPRQTVCAANPGPFLKTSRRTRFMLYIRSAPGDPSFQQCPSYPTRGIAGSARDEGGT